MSIGDTALYKGMVVTVTDETIYLPSLRQIEWIENGIKRFKWVHDYELTLLEAQ